MGNFTPTDPAERSLFMRLLYCNWRPTLLGRWIGRLMIWWTGLRTSPGIVGILEVRDATPGQKTTVPMVVTRVDGAQYLVSTLGAESNWVKNVEAAKGAAFLRHGSARAVHLVAMAANERAPILNEYVRIATSGRKHVPLNADAPLSEFTKIAERYPVYRIDPARSDSRA
jgi:hypothetical protein